MHDPRRAAIKRPLGRHNSAAEHLADRLMAEADAENRDLARKLRDDGFGNSRLARRAWPGRNHDHRRRGAADRGNVDFIVTAHDDIAAQFLEITGDVEDEQVIIVG